MAYEPNNQRPHKGRLQRTTAKDGRQRSRADKGPRRVTDIPRRLSVIREVEPAPEHSRMGCDRPRH